MPNSRTSLARRSLYTVLWTLFSFTALAAETITGTVTNKTNNKPAAGDDVVLIRLAQGMQEASRTKSDAHGHFSLDVPDQGVHLVRVTHDKANYFRPAPPGTQSIDIDVFNAAAKVEGVAGEAVVIRLQTDETGKNLKVVENFFIKNDSTPPRTQFSDHAFEFFLPAGAIVSGSAALAPGSMPVQAPPVPLGDPNHYAFVFPIRPGGETRFQVTYQLPYTGSFQFDPRVSLPTDTIAIMMPKSMTFKASGAVGYSPVTEETTAQTYVARNAQPSEPLGFTVSGSGQLPRDEAPGATSGATAANTSGAAPDTSGATPDATGTAATDNRPGGGLGNPIDPTGSNDPWAKYKWWIIGGLGLALAAAGGFLLRSTPSTPAAGPFTHPNTPNLHGIPAPHDGHLLLAALKEELFSVETDRLQGKLSEGDYLEQKSALEVVLRRALRRSNPATTSHPQPQTTTV